MSPFFAKITIFITFITLLCTFLVFLKGVRLARIGDRDPQSAYRGYVRQHGDYWVWHNYIVSKDVYLKNSSITLATHGTYMDLGMVPLLVSRWKGPISLTLYTNADDYLRTIAALGYINNCVGKISNLVSKYVTVHICLKHGYLPKQFERAKSWDNFVPMACDELPQYFNGSQVNTFWYRNKFPYPVNLLRNIARMNAHTDYIMTLDINLLPSENFIRNFLYYIRFNGKCFKCVYCLPTFSIAPLNDTHIPSNKKSLIELMEKSTNLTKPYVNNIILQNLWLTSIQPLNQISVYSYSKANHMCSGYVILNQIAPLYDERCTVESLHTPSTLTVSLRHTWMGHF